MNIPRIVIAGTNSGCGKTTVTAGIMAALVKKGFKVQPFKVGPDYIDPMFHTFVTGNASRNLDSWMLEEDIIKYLFTKNAAGCDLSIIEGVMGLYDGYGGYSKEGSTSHVANILKAPVVLLVNGEGLSLSAAALIKGFMDFDKDAEIKGVIINNLKSEHHYQLLKGIIEDNLGVAVLGYLPIMPWLQIPSRHLGLVQSSEISDLREMLDKLALQVEKTVDLDFLVKLAGQADELFYNSLESAVVKKTGSPRIAVAKDKAFSFYYKDNLELLELFGAELVYFSPLKDTGIPENVHGLYVGGGYPELWAKELESNLKMKKTIYEKIQEGLPAYAECGGLMYLSKAIRTKEGHTYEMVAAIPGISEMKTSLQRFGYVNIDVTDDNVISKRGFRMKAHEFHYSSTSVGVDVPTCFNVQKVRKGMEPITWECGFKVNNLLAGYPHLHFWSNTEFAKCFVDNCIKYKREREAI